MKISRLNIFLLLLFVVSVIGNWSIGRNYEQPNWEFIPEMVHSVPYDTYAPNPNFEDGMTLRKPVSNTVPRGMLPLHYNATPEDAERAGKELHNPYPLIPHVGSLIAFSPNSHMASLALAPRLSLESKREQNAELKPSALIHDAAFLERGARVWKNYCQVCHGASGKGDGPVTRRGVPPPPSLLIEKAVKMKDGQMFHVLTYGQGNMSSYASQLSRQDRWLAIMYIRSLQQEAAKSGGAK